MRNNCLFGILLFSEIFFCNGFQTLSISMKRTNIRNEFKPKLCHGRKSIVSMNTENNEADAELDEGRRILIASSLATIATIGSLYLAVPQILGPATRAQV